MAKLRSAIALGTVAAVGMLTLAACGAGSRAGAENATAVACDFVDPSEPTTVNVLAYNSPTVDPFTNTMVSSCTKGNVTIKHDPIDFGGQVTKTQSTLAGDTGSYDIIETYNFIIPGYGAEEKFVPLDDLFEKYREKHALDEISENTLAGMSYDGKLLGLPMNAQMFITVYRKDIFADLGLAVPTTFDELVAAAEAIRKAGLMEYPVVFPWNANSELNSWFQAGLKSLGTDFLSDDGKVQANTPEVRRVLEEMLKIKPYMDPQVTTFDVAKTQQQMFNGTAAITILFSGRMIDFTLESNSSLYENFAFAPPPKLTADAPYSYNRLSVDGWSIPVNTKLDHDLLFEIIATAVGKEASLAAVPAAYPAREGLVTAENSPYGEAAKISLVDAQPPSSSPKLPDVTNAIRPIVAEILIGNLSIDEGMAKMQAEGEKAAG